MYSRGTATTGCTGSIFVSFCVSWLKRVNRRQPRRHRLHAPVAVLVVLPQLLVAGHLLVLLLPAAAARPRQGTSVSVPLGILFVLDDSFTTQFLDRSQEKEMWLETFDNE